MLRRLESIGLDESELRWIWQVTIPIRGFPSLASAQQAVAQALEGNVMDAISGQDMGWSYVFALPMHPDSRHRLLDARQKLEAKLRAAGIHGKARLLRRSNPERRRSDRTDSLPIL